MIEDEEKLREMVVENLIAMLFRWQRFCRFLRKRKGSDVRGSGALDRAVEHQFPDVPDRDPL